MKVIAYVYVIVFSTFLYQCELEESICEVYIQNNTDDFLHVRDIFRNPKNSSFTNKSFHIFSICFSNNKELENIKCEIKGEEVNELDSIIKVLESIDYIVKFPDDKCDKFVAKLCIEAKNASIFYPKDSSYKFVTE